MLLPQVPPQTPALQGGGKIEVKPYYDDGRGIVIYHGDCREILPLLESVDLLLTDPPYGIGFASRPTNYQRMNGMKASGWDDFKIDSTTLLSARNLARFQIIWGGNYYQLPLCRCWLVWTKPDSPPTMGSVEMAWTNIDRPARHIDRSISATNAERVGHPTQKPLDVMAWCISLAPNSDTILDPFMGSGTTLRAAKDLGRKAIGIEIEEKYCEIAVRRLAQEVLL